MTISVTSNEHSVFGNKAIALADVAFDSSYPTGGEPFNPETLFGLHEVNLALIEPKQGYSFEYDYTNKKIKVFAPAPPIVYEEKHTTSGDVVTTNYPAAFFMNVARSGNSKKFRSTGIALNSLSDDEISLVEQMAEGERTQLTVKDYDRLSGQGAFTGAATGWTLAAGWAYGTNNVTHSSNGTGTAAHDAFAAVAGRTYRLTYTISGWTVGTVTPALGGVTGTAVGANGTYTAEFTATSTAGLTFTPTSTARFTLDSVTVYDLSEPVYITYVTQAWKDVWDNLVQDEALTLATGANTLTSGNKIAACMYIDQTTATAAALTMIDEDDTAASGEIDLKLNAATAQFTAHADQNTKAVKTTYIKVPTAGFLTDRLFTNETATKAGADPYTSTFDYPILLWAYTGQVPINGGATLRLIDYAGTPATGEAVIDWFTPGVRGAGAPAGGGVIGTKDNVTATGAGIWGTINEIQNLQPLEVKDGTDLSALSSVRAILIGI